MVSQFSDKRKKFLNLFNTEWDIEYQFYKNISSIFNYLEDDKHFINLKITNEEDFNSFLTYILIIKILHLIRYNYHGNISENDLNTLKFLCKKFKYCPNIPDTEYFYTILRDINDENYEKLAVNNFIDRRVKDTIMPFIKEIGKAEYDDTTETDWYDGEPKPIGEK